VGIAEPIRPSGIRPSGVTKLTGREQLSTGLNVLEFWQWALGDLRMNTIRGFLVEFLVAQAVGATAPHRVEWAPFDVEGADGTRIEVKATAYLQSWVSPKLTTPRWTFATVDSATSWDADSGQEIPIDPLDRADVWVFALQTCQSPNEYDPLDIDRWEFRVVPHVQLFELEQRSTGVSTLDKLGAMPVALDGLADAVKKARNANNALSKRARQKR
jgi:hypothetical protein